MSTSGAPRTRLDRMALLPAPAARKQLQTGLGERRMMIKNVGRFRSAPTHRRTGPGRPATGLRGFNPMPGTATQLYPIAGPRVNGYRSVGAGAVIVGAGLRAGRKRVAWDRQERVDCTAAWFSQCLAPRSSRKLFCPTPAEEVTGHAPVATWGTGFEGGMVLMCAGGRATIGAAGSDGIHRWPAVVRVAGADSLRRGKA